VPTPATRQNLLDLLAAGELLLLPNARAARALRAAFDAAQQARGLTAWQPANALAWQQWTASLYANLITSGREPRILLNQAQEHTLWREIVSANQPESLASADSLSDLAQNAWELAAAHSATHLLHTNATSLDSRTFAQWAETFTKRCAKDELLSAALLESALLQHLSGAPGPNSRTRVSREPQGPGPATSLEIPTTLHLVGFTDLTPSQQSLLNALKSQGTTLTHNTLVAPEGTTLRTHLQAPNEREELILAARWIRQYLESSPQSETVAILVPNLADDRANLESTLCEILAPELQNISADLSSTPWEFSTGTPLASHPIISTVLSLANWAQHPLPLDQIAALLLSPYLGNASDRDQSARFDAQVLRRHTLLQPQLTLPALITLANQKSETATLPTWPRSLNHFLANQDLTKTSTYGDWTEFLRSLAKSANWPGDRPLTAAEFELTRTWDSTLDLIATLDFTGRRVPFATFLQALQRQAQTAPATAPQTNAPVQIMSPEDSAGSLFDATVFLRATDANWPTPTRPNPLLGWPLQKSLQMPGTDATQTSARTLRFTEDLLTRSTQTLFLSAEQNPDGHLRPSPLLKTLNIPTLNPTQVLPDQPVPDQITPEILPDDQPLPPLPPGLVFGGTKLLQSQAACGFRAFAEFRLSSTTPQSQDLGLNAADSGEHIHRVLELFWKHTRTQQNLRDLTPDQRDEALLYCIDQALGRHLHANTPWELAYLEAQRQRLLTLLRRWLDHELLRGPFEVIDAEHGTTHEIGPLSLRLRIDRIDTVGTTPDGDQAIVLVDYKTSRSAAPNLWEGDRPDEPQLPLYALIPAPGTVKAVTFAKLRPGDEMKWHGYQSDQGILPSSRNNTLKLQPLLEEWEVVLTQLAHDFADGRALVNPKDYPRTCVYCEQRLLCRLDPTQLSEPSEESEDLDG